jgi:hypothetical protein
VSVALGLSGLRLRLAFRYADLLPQRHPFIETQNEYGKNRASRGGVWGKPASAFGRYVTIPTLMLTTASASGHRRRQRRRTMRRGTSSTPSSRWRRWTRTSAVRG